jgi:diketogulonate reductase-like aldo/keto reductase
MSELRRIGSTALETPRLVLGGNVFGWTARGEEAFRILDAFAEAGGRMIDTADVYSAWAPGHRGGESETLIGEWLRRRGGKGDMLIATKVGMLPGEGGEKLEPARIAAAAEASLTPTRTMSARRWPRASPRSTGWCATARCASSARPIIRPAGSRRRWRSAAARGLPATTCCRTNII